MRGRCSYLPGRRHAAFEIKTPVGINQLLMKHQIHEAIAEATKQGKLRPNSVDSLSGKNSGNNLGDGTPIIHFEQWESDDIEVRLILKGGGCENKAAVKELTKFAEPSSTIELLNSPQVTLKE